MSKAKSIFEMVGSNPFGGAAGAATDRISLLSLIVANVIPIPLAIIFGWDVGGVIMLYWWENLVVGFYAILRMGLAKNNLFSTGEKNDKPKLFMIPFFCFHYFFFCFVHGVFLLTMLSMSSGGTPDVPLDSSTGRSWPGPLFIIPVMGNLFAHAWHSMPPAAVVSVLLLLASHGISFARNYMGRGEYLKASAPIEMIRPYGRVVLLHVCILFGGMLTLLFGSPLGLVVLFMIGKTAIDASIHTRSHLGFAKQFLNVEAVTEAAKTAGSKGSGR